MKYIDEYRNGDLINKLIDTIRQNTVRDYSFMEVCGGHTAAIYRFGIHTLLPERVRLVSGPGCPVCVTETDFIDKAVTLARQNNVIIATFGDLLKVPGSFSSLEFERAHDHDVRVILSAGDGLEIARRNPGKTVIFPAIGFETTAPGTALTILEAAKGNIGNFLVLCGHKVMPPAIRALLVGGTDINGFICPGHVATITGSGIFGFIPRDYNVASVVSGFEPADILLSILMLIKQVNSKKYSVEIQYKRAVTADGNQIALKMMREAFEPADVNWRGFGMISSGGLRLRRYFKNFDADAIYKLNVAPGMTDEKCICGLILRAVKTPPDCSLFANRCTPDNPVGACMVSPEGCCNVWYRYKRENG